MDQHGCELHRSRWPEDEDARSSDVWRRTQKHLLTLQRGQDKRESL